MGPYWVAMTRQNSWLQGAVIYQIYPRSFYDALDTGIGNLAGIIAKLDYLAGGKDSLGVNAIWISPIYTSPMADFGYDVADYTDVDPLFGTLSDLKKLVHEAHKRSIKVILDFVPNHTSNQHPWFIESKSSLHNPKRDWYTWRDPLPDGSLPNNWLSIFGGPAWKLCEETNQYYLHTFLSKQPDLNWDNPEVRDAMKAAMRFWLKLGVDGFRVDAVDWLSKDEQLRDDPLKKHATAAIDMSDYFAYRHLNSRDGLHLFDRLNEMTGVLAEYEDRFMITEAHPETENKIQGYLPYYKSVNPHLSAPFNFEGIYLPWEAQAFRKFVDTFQAAMKPGYIPIYTLGNHDESRIVTRVGAQAARTAAMMLLTLPGMICMYYGDEIGMHDVAIPAAQAEDPITKPSRNRDPQRTPMQWDTSAEGGFTTSVPWLPVASDFPQNNVATESEVSTSSLALYKRLIRFHNQSSILKSEAYHSVDVQEHVFAYYRGNGKNKLLVLLNFTDENQRVVIKGLRGVVQLSTGLDRDGMAISERGSLRPHEGLIIRVLY
jgi:alpha-glucosidase